MKLLNMSRLAVATAALFFNGLAAGAEVKCLGMTLVNPGEQLLKNYDLPAGPSGPVITAVHDRSFFPEGMVPTEGALSGWWNPKPKG